MAHEPYAPAWPSALSGSQTVGGDAQAAETALREIQDQVARVWETLQSHTAPEPLFEQAIRRATPIVPCIVAPSPRSARHLNRDLRIALQNYHPEEIRVVGYTLFSSLLELVEDQCGKPKAERLQHLLSPQT